MQGRVPPRARYHRVVDLLVETAGYRLEADRGVLTLSASATIPRGQAARRLGAIADAHTRTSHPRLLRTLAVELDAATPTVRFSGRARSHLGRLRVAFGRRGERVPYAFGVALSSWLAEVWIELAGGRDRFGALAPANVLLTPEGEIELLGLGDNVFALDATGRPAGFESFASLRVASGVPADAYDDAMAAQALLRSFASTVELPPRLARLIARDPTLPLDVSRRFEDWISNRVFDAGRRAGRPELVVSAFRAFWRTLSVVGDEAGLQREIARHVSEDLALAAPELRLERAARRIVRAPGGPIELRARAPAFALALALAEQHATVPGASLGIDALFAAGWPGERARSTSRANRVYVTLSHLRAAGLRDVLQREGGGYRFDPGWKVAIVP